MTGSIVSIEWVRLLLLYAHLLASMLAIAAVLSADVGLLFGKLSRERLRITVKHGVCLLLVLWVTGVALVWLDTGFHPAELQARPKLLLKLIAVSVLTLNGIVLHHLSFPLLVSARPLTFDATSLLAVTGSLSTMHWLLAAFIGIADPLRSMPIEQLIRGYMLLLVSVVAISFICVPWLRQRVLKWRQVSRTTLPSETTLVRATR